jgi:hypothetical protein
MCPDESFSLIRLRVVADSDPAAIGTVIHRFQNLNIVPRRINAEFGIDERLHIEVDVCGVTVEQPAIIASKISESPSIHHTQWYPLT